MQNITRAYEKAETIRECPGCTGGMIAITEYKIMCPLLSAQCKHGQVLHKRLEVQALDSVKALPGVPRRFHNRLGTPHPTEAIRGVNLWSWGQKCFLVLHGENGTGKSFGAAYALVVLARLRLLNDWKLPMSWTSLPTLWESAYRVTSKDDLFEMARSIPVLVIDDLGSEENTHRARGRLAEIVSKRYDQQRTTILTMNEDVLELEKIYGRRMTDRILSAGHTVYCGGESLRLTA
jgi:hypothetical protein